MEFKNIVIFSMTSLIVMGCQKEGGSSSSSSSGEPMGQKTQLKVALQLGGQRSR